MILGFKHKGLARFYHKGVTDGIQFAHKAKLARQLARLDSAKQVADMNIPGWELHPLKGNLAGFWSVKVSGNWRLVFKFACEHVEVVDYLDYH